MAPNWLARIGLCGLLAAPVAFTSACTGSVRPEERAPSSSDDDSDDDGPPPIGATCTDELLPLGTRRLTRSEYAHTVRDLFSGIDLPTLTVTADLNPGGFETEVSKLYPQESLIGDYQSVSSKVAAKALENLDALLPCSPSQGSRCAHEFVDTFGPRAFRRPLTEAESEAFKGLFDELNQSVSFEEALALTLEAFLQSPEFLYRIELEAGQGAEPERIKGYEMASRLSYLLWGSMPDQELFDAAAEGALDTPAQIRQQAERMIADGRAAEQIVDFHRQWLGFDHVVDDPELKDPETYPHYKDSMREDLRQEALWFTRKVMFEEEGNLGALLTDTRARVNADLAKLYGVASPGSGWAEAKLDGNERAGILTRGFFLAGHAHQLSGSPPLRGVFVLKHLLCIEPGPPDPNADLSEPSGNEGAELKLTNREAFALRLEQGGRHCVSCHQAFDPFGNAFEHYDAIGGYRDIDNGKPVDASGELDGKPFANALELMPLMAEMPEVQACITSNLLAFAEGRSREEVSECTRDEIAKRVKEGASVREVLVDITQTRDFLYRMGR